MGIVFCCGWFCYHYSTSRLHHGLKQHGDSHYILLKRMIMCLQKMFASLSSQLYVRTLWCQDCVIGGSTTLWFYSILVFKTSSKPCGRAGRDITQSTQYQVVPLLSIHMCYIRHNHFLRDLQRHCLLVDCSWHWHCTMNIREKDIIVFMYIVHSPI